MQCPPCVGGEDSVQVVTKVVHDSVYDYQHDSIYITQRADTIYYYKEKIRYKTQLVAHTDTIYKEKVITIPPPPAQKYVPAFYKWCAGILFSLVIGIIVYVILKIWI